MILNWKVLSIRRDDIIRRYNIKVQLKKEREEIIIKKNDREEKKQNELNEAKDVLFL